MFYATKDLLDKGENEYSIREALKDGRLHLVERGFYSTEPDPILDEAFFCLKYKGAIITGLSAYDYYDLTDLIPEKIYLACPQHTFPYRREEIVQSYMSPAYFDVGAVYVDTPTGKIRIYSLERMLIETIRLKERMPAELFYEVIASFRIRKEELDFYSLISYAKAFKNGKTILKRIKEII